MKRNKNRSICDHIPGSRSVTTQELTPVTTNFLDQFCDHKLPDDCDHRGLLQGCDHIPGSRATSGPGDAFLVKILGPDQNYVNTCHDFGSRIMSKETY